ncbi:MAG: hypothetical protein HY716_03220 [Planctomycetes bacterium]|nr:hypothetical protein [Planctomycetota bacterium]
MRSTGLALSMVAAVALLGFPGAAHADIVPCRPTVPESESSRLKERLTSLGVRAATAETRVASLTAHELEFFANDALSVQVVGGLTFFEFAGGAFVMAIVGVMALGVYGHTIKE